MERRQRSLWGDFCDIFTVRTVHFLDIEVVRLLGRFKDQVKLKVNFKSLISHLLHLLQMLCMKLSKL